MTLRARAEELYKALYSSDLIDAPDEANVDYVEAHLATVAAAAFDAALADVVRLLKHTRALNSARLVAALAEDAKMLRDKTRAKTEFPALRAAVPLG